MIRGISFYDVLSIPEFSHMKHFDLLPTTMDSKVSPYLFKLGIDTSHVILIQACKHRKDDGQVVLGYRYVGRERTDKPWLNCVHSTMAARIDSQKDKHLAAEMLRMSKEGQDWRSFKAMAIASAKAEDITAAQRHGLEEEKPEPSYREDISEIQSLMEVQRAVRGYIHPDEDTLNPPKGIY